MVSLRLSTGLALASVLALASCSPSKKAIVAEASEAVRGAFGPLRDERRLKRCRGATDRLQHRLRVDKTFRASVQLERLHEMVAEAKRNGVVTPKEAKGLLLEMERLVDPEGIAARQPERSVVVPASVKAVLAASEEPFEGFRFVFKDLPASKPLSGGILPIDAGCRCPNMTAYRALPDLLRPTASDDVGYVLWMEDLGEETVGWYRQENSDRVAGYAKRKRYRVTLVDVRKRVRWPPHDTQTTPIESIPQRSGTGSWKDPHGDTRMAHLAVRFAMEALSGHQRQARLLSGQCEQDDPRACTQLATLYLAGTGVRKSKSRALELYEKACNLQYRRACWELVSPRANAEPKMLRKRCEQGDPRACTQLAAAHLAGTGVRKSRVIALDLYEKACDLKYRRACRQLADLRANATPKKKASARETTSGRP